jgi:hypothetical protein
MAKETKAQQAKVERVMHEFKEGDLKSSTGAKVKSRKQAVAIALSEAGASNKQSPSQQKKAASKKRS